MLPKQPEVTGNPSLLQPLDWVSRTGKQYLFYKNTNMCYIPKYSNSVATAFPIPVPPPVTMATLFLKSCERKTLFGCFNFRLDPGVNIAGMPTT